MKLQLAEQGLPVPVVKAYAGKGIQQLYPWQAGAIECGEDGSNLVYCAPTSGASQQHVPGDLGRAIAETGRTRSPTAGGKSLVADVAGSCVGQLRSLAGDALHKWLQRADEAHL